MSDNDLDAIAELVAPKQAAWYHASDANLDGEDYVFPAEDTGVESNYEPDEYDRQRVFVTDSPESAREWGKNVYQVRPTDEPEEEGQEHTYSHVGPMKIIRKIQSKPEVTSKEAAWYHASDSDLDNEAHVYPAAVLGVDSNYHSDELDRDRVFMTDSLEHAHQWGRNVYQVQPRYEPDEDDEHVFSHPGPVKIIRKVPSKPEQAIEAAQEPDYKMQHQAPRYDPEGTTAPLHDIENVMPDYYQHPEWYGGGSDEPGGWESANIIRKLRGDPEAKVRVYRALPAEHAHHGINPGDWVGISKEYARQHGRQTSETGADDWPVISAVVKAKHLFNEGYPTEFGYDGPELAPEAHSVAFKGGRNQEIRQQADGTIRPVQRRAPSPVKGFSFNWNPTHWTDPERGGQAETYDPQGNYAGHIAVDEAGNETEKHFEPQHAGIADELEKRLRQKIPVGYDKFMEQQQTTAVALIAPTVAVVDAPVHRGISIRLSGKAYDAIHDPASSPEDIAKRILDQTSRRASLGMHWSTDPEQALDFASKSPRTGSSDLPIILHAAHPAPEDIETRPSMLKRRQVHEHDHWEQEVPVRKGANVQVTGISWHPHEPHPAADKNGWMHYDFASAMPYTAAKQADDDHLVLYHGTLRDHLPGIQQKGLTSIQGNPASWFMLTDSRGQAERYTSGRPGGVVLEYHIPKRLSDYREDGALLWPGHTTDVYGYHGMNYAPKEPIPSQYLKAVHEVTPEEQQATATVKVSGVMDYLTERHPSIDHWVSERPDSIVLDKLVVPKGQRGQGIGSAYMNDLVNYADSKGKRVELTPDTSFGGSSKSRLQRFYKGFGFVPNKDQSISNTMVRPASPIQTTAAAVTPTTYYHGSDQDFAPGTMVTPGHDSRFHQEEQGPQARQHVFIATDPEVANLYGKSVYEVEPTGEVTHDPEYSSERKHPTHWRTMSPMKVIRKSHERDQYGNITPVEPKVAVLDQSPQPFPADVTAVLQDDGPFYHGTRAELRPGAREQAGPTRPSKLAAQIAVPHFSLANPPDPVSKQAAIDFVQRAEVAEDPDLAFHKQATWGDVRRKAKDIRQSGGVRILAFKDGTLVGHVRGDTNVYESSIVFVPGSNTTGSWHCGCAWAAYSWGRTGRWRKFEGRRCSHVLALQFEAQARRMLGRELKLDVEVPHWIDPTIPVRTPGEYDRDKGRHGVKAAVEDVDEQAHAKGVGADWRAQLAPHHEDLVRRWEKMRNGELLSGDERKSLLKLVNAAPEVPDTVYRGALSAGRSGWDPLLEKHQPGAAVNFSRNSSVTTRPEVAAGFGHVVYEIRGQHHARGIGNTLHEAIMPPGKFVVQSADMRDDFPFRAAIDGKTLAKTTRLHVVLRPAAEAARVAALGPEPKYEDYAGDMDRYQVDRDQWRSNIRRELSMGHISPDEAVEHGYHGWNHDQHEYRPNWKPLPPVLYHVTTNLGGVRQHGLMSRTELGQRAGKGLGGGEDDTISYTENPETARNILQSVKEFHNVVTGKTTPADLWAQAERGEGASRPFHQDLASFWDGSWEPGKPLPLGLDATLRGTKIKQGLASQAEMDAKEPGWQPHPSATPLGGGGKLYTLWHRKATPEEQRESAAELYKRFSAFREHAGGRPDPLFFGTDVHGFAQTDPSQIGIVKAHPKPGAQGYQLGALGEWRTTTGQNVDIDPGHDPKTATVTVESAKNEEMDGPQKGGIKTATIRTMQPAEYSQLKIGDFRDKSLPALAKRLRRNAPDYYQALHEDIARNGVRAPILVDGNTIMDGHHRLAIAHELGLPVRVGDYNNEADYDAAGADRPLINEWMRKRYDMGAQRTSDRKTAATVTTTGIGLDKTLPEPPDFAHDTYQGEVQLRRHAVYPRNIDQSGAEAKLQEVLKAHNIPQADQAFVELNHGRTDSNPVYDTDTYPWIPGVTLGVGMHDHLSLLHEAAHIIDQYKMYGGPTTRPGTRNKSDVHDGAWLETYRQLVHDHLHPQAGRKFDEIFPPGQRPKVRTPKVAVKKAAYEPDQTVHSHDTENRTSYGPGYTIKSHPTYDSGKAHAILGEIENQFGEDHPITGTLTEHALQHRSGRIAVMRSNKDREILGLAHFHHLDDNDKHYVLDSMAVAPGRQGHGLGHALISHVASQTPPGSQMVAPDSVETAVPFYQSTGATYRNDLDETGHWDAKALDAHRAIPQGARFPVDQDALAERAEARSAHGKQDVLNTPGMTGDTVVDNRLGPVDQQFPDAPRDAQGRVLLWHPTEHTEVFDENPSPDGRFHYRPVRHWNDMQRAATEESYGNFGPLWTSEAKARDMAALEARTHQSPHAVVGAWWDPKDLGNGPSDEETEYGGVPVLPGGHAEIHSVEMTDHDHPGQWQQIPFDPGTRVLGRQPPGPYDQPDPDVAPPPIPGEQPRTIPDFDPVKDFEAKHPVVINPIDLPNVAPEPELPRPENGWRDIKGLGHEELLPAMHHFRERRDAGDIPEDADPFDYEYQTEPTYRLRPRTATLDPADLIPDPDWIPEQEPKTAALNSPDELPPEPGKAPIPAGHVRVFHYTGTPNLPSIRQHGLTLGHAKGENYGETSQIWGATGQVPDEANHLGNTGRGYVEFHIDPADLNFGHERTAEELNDPQSRHHVTTFKDVPPENIVAIHEPWHQHARYMQGSDDPVGEYSWLKDDDSLGPDYQKAYDYVASHPKVADLIPARLPEPEFKIDATPTSFDVQNGGNVGDKQAKATGLTFHKTHAGRYHARGGAHAYTVLKDGRSWLLRIDHGEPGQERQVHADHHDTLALAQRVAHHFEALGDDYQAHQHGGKNRATVATLRAYDEPEGRTAATDDALDPVDLIPVQIPGPEFKVAKSSARIDQTGFRSNNLIATNPEEQASTYERLGHPQWAPRVRDFVASDGKTYRMVHQNSTHPSGTITIHEPRGKGYRGIGYLSFHEVPGEDRQQIYKAHVHPDYQRRGLATAMFNFARETHPNLGHSHALTDEGKAWAEATPTPFDVQNGGGIRGTAAITQTAAGKLPPHTYNFTLPDGRKTTRTTNHEYTHGVAVDYTNDPERPDSTGWGLASAHSSMPAAVKQVNWWKRISDNPTKIIQVDNPRPAPGEPAGKPSPQAAPASPGDLAKDWKVKRWFKRPQPGQDPMVSEMMGLYKGNAYRYTEHQYQDGRHHLIVSDDAGNRHEADVPDSDSVPAMQHELLERIWGNRWQPPDRTAVACPADGQELMFDPADGYQHPDGSISHDDGYSVTDHLQAAGIPLTATAARETVDSLQGVGPGEYLVPIPEVARYQGHGLYRSAEEIKALTKDIAANGVKRPLTFTMEPGWTTAGGEHYYSEEPTPFMHDGHHRLSAAKWAGLTHVPVNVYANNRDADQALREHTREGFDFYNRALGREPEPEDNHSGYVPKGPVGLPPLTSEVTGLPSAIAYTAQMVDVLGMVAERIELAEAATMEGGFELPNLARGREHLQAARSDALAAQRALEDRLAVRDAMSTVAGPVGSTDFLLDGATVPGDPDGVAYDEQTDGVHRPNWR